MGSEMCIRDSYLGGLEPAIPADDVTELVIKTMQENLKKAGNR